MSTLVKDQPGFAEWQALPLTQVLLANAKRERDKAQKQIDDVTCQACQQRKPNYGSEVGIAVLHGTIAMANALIDVLEADAVAQSTEAA